MIHKIDTMWAKAIGKVQRWTIRQAQAHCQRQKQRRFERFMKAQNPERN